MKALWQQYQAWFALRTQRERIILAASALFLLVYPALLYVIDPALATAREARSKAQQQRNEAAQLQAQIAAMQALAKDPEAGAKKMLLDLQQQIAAQAPRFKAVEQTIVPAAKVTALLENLLAQNRALQLVSLKSMPPMALLERKGTGDGKAGPLDANVYRHGVEIIFTGSYADMLAYLDELEKSPQPVLWSRLLLDASDHTRLVMKVEINTLSLDKAWLAL